MNPPRLSEFLPADFDPTRPVALIAGQGLYPALVAERLRHHRIPLRLVAFEGETRPELTASVPEPERAVLKVGQLGKMLNSLERFQAGYVFMAGQITPRRLFQGLHPDLKAARLLFSLKERNAETIFGAIAAEIEALGICILDARSFLEDQLSTPGVMTGGRFPIAEEYLRHGIRIAREVARLDIGQSVVVRKGTVIAVEAFEGTDQMLRRAGEFRADSMLLIKTVKPDQDFRFDVPIFGSTTLKNLQAAGIRCAALESGKSIMLEKARLLEEAAKIGIQICGF